jgi:hypothetical protein
MGVLNLLAIESNDEIEKKQHFTGRAIHINGYELYPVKRRLPIFSRGVP